MPEMLPLLIIGAAALALGHAQNASTADTTQPVDVYYPTEDWSDTFDWKLLKSFSTYPRHNVLLSPVSLKLVLALLYEGSGGLTEREFQRVMQFSVHKQLVRERFSATLNSLQASDRKEYVLNIGTRIFLDSSLEPQQNYAAKALHNYHTEIQQLNYSQPTEASHTINSWIEKVTNGKISELTKPADLANTIMLVGNAVFYRGSWMKPFNKTKSHRGGFYLSPSEVVQVPYMVTSAEFFYHDSVELDAKILRMPYRGRRHSMFIILPNSKGGLPDLIRKVNLQLIKSQLYILEPHSLVVKLPRFKFNFQASFTKTLQDYGLLQMFQNTASFPGIVRGTRNVLRRLVVSDILQRSGIEVDEEGSTVFSTSFVQVNNKFREIEFNATHPFMFFIEDETSGTILFIGKVENPLEVEPLPLPNRSTEPEKPPTVATTSPPAIHAASLPSLQPVNTDIDSMLSRFNYFDLELLKEFSETSSNIFISPASIKTTLALILEGAGGRSAQEILNALRIQDIDQKEVRDILRQMLFDLSDSSGGSTILEAASAVFASSKYQINPIYQQKVVDDYRALARSVDFTNPDEAAQIINTWASNATRGVINEIVNSQYLFADTTMILANALYFKGKWKTAFDIKGTQVKCFKTTTRGCVKTHMMQVTDTFNYNLILDLNAHAIELPYQDEKYAMLVLLPNNGHSVRVLARDMQHAKFNAILDQLRPTDLIIELPRFEIDFTVDLIDYLRPMKIQEVFSLNANLSGIISQENGRISSVVHKTRVEVTEQGTKAAAVTGAIVIPLMGSTNNHIVADSPFIFFIYNKQTRNIIFEGILVDPDQQYNKPLKPTVKPTIPFTRYRPF